MKLKDTSAPSSGNPGRIVIDDIISELFHEAQNGVHLVGMELELVSMGLGENSDAEKAAGVVTQLQQNLRDLRGYISALQHPGASCEIAAVLEMLLATAGQRRRKAQNPPLVDVTAPAPPVRMDGKTVMRILERVWEFCDDLLPAGGELAIRTGRLRKDREIFCEIELTMHSPVDMPSISDGELWRGAAGGPPRRGLERALEVLRRHGGQMLFRRESDRKYSLTLLLPAISA
jgi:hypothetical protein